MINGKTKKITYILVTAVIAFVLIEGAARMIWFVRYGTFDIDCKKTRIFVPDRYTGYRLRPGYDAARDFNERCESDLPVVRGTKVAYMPAAWRMKHRNDKTFTVNSLGFRSPEITAADRSKFLILALGGSTTMGNGVSDEMTWPACLEKQMKKRGFGNIKVVNAGVGGFGSRNEFRLFKHYALSLKPDLVLVHDGWNEVSMVWTMGKKWDNSYLGDLSYITGVNKYVYDCPFLSLRLGYSGLKRLLNKLRHLKAKGSASYTSSLPEIRKDFWVRAWHDNLNELKELAASVGGEVYLLDYPGLCRQEASVEEKDMAMGQTRVGNTVNYNYWIRAKARITEALNSFKDMKVIDAAECFSGISGKDYLDLFMDEMHMSEKGDDVFAASVADKLSVDGYFLGKYAQKLEEMSGI